MGICRFSVVIVFSKTESELIALVDSLARSDFDPLKDEILVVTSKPQLPLNLPARWIMAQSSFVGARKNQGLNAAEGELVLFLDDDVVVTEPNFFAKLYACFADPKVVAAGGHYRSSAQISRSSRAYNRILEVYLKTQGNRVSLLGGNFCFRARLKVAFDETRPYGAVEDPLMLDLQSLGRLVYRPELSVLHDPRINVLSLISKAWKQGSHQTMGHGGPSFFSKIKMSLAHEFQGILLIFVYHLFNKLARILRRPAQITLKGLRSHG